MVLTDVSDIMSGLCARGGGGGGGGLQPQK